MEAMYETSSWVPQKLFETHGDVVSSGRGVRQHRVNEVAFWHQPSARYMKVQWKAAVVALLGQQDAVDSDSCTVRINDWLDVDHMSPSQSLVSICIVVIPSRAVCNMFSLPAAR